MNKVDLEHKLLYGSEICVGDIPTYKVSLGQMANYKFGYSTCNQCIGLLCMDDEKAGELFDNDLEKTTFNFICTKIYVELLAIQEGKIGNEDIENLMITTLPPFLEMVFGDKVVFDPNNLRFIIGDGENVKYLTNDNFGKFRSILKERNCLMDVDGIEDEDNPANSKAKILLEQRKKIRERLKKAKQNSEDDDGLTMSDLISIFAEAEHKSLQDVYENYDVFQFNNQFNRLKIMEDYQVNIKALLAGAKSEEIQLQHWLSKIKKQDE